MRTITVVYERHHYLYRWLKPLFAARRELKSLGYRVKYQSLIDYLPVFKGGMQKRLEKRALDKAARTDNDIVMMAFHHSTSDFCSKLTEAERAAVLKDIKAHCNMLVWLDTADSTGTCMFDVMPYVDLYFKKQLLRDRSRYCSEMYGSRLFCEFYHDMLGIEDPKITERRYPVLAPEYLDKLRVSWNVGLGDIFADKPYKLIFHPHSVTKPTFLSVDTPRSLDVQYRGNGYSPVAGYPRSESKRRLEKMSGIRCSDMSRIIPKDEYIKEGQSARSILSPFGWGEICGRDFEAIVYGACMIKQSMEEFETFPDMYRPMSTYVPLRWDFSDFEDVLSQSASEGYHDIAREAQKEYARWFTPEGRMDFARHLVDELERKN